MNIELECEGQVRLGPLPWDLSERLSQFSGNWLEFSPKESTIIARKSLPVGCPATTAVSCELITLIESLTPELRLAMPGGEFFVKAHSGRIMRFAVEKGEIRIQWPSEDYSRAIPVTPESVLSSLSASEASINGWARFAGARSRRREIEAFAEHFGGLYPEGDMPSECEQNIAYVPFKGVSVDPDKLVNRLQSLAEPGESLQAQIDVSCPSPRSEDREYRILIRNGKVEALRPSLWKRD